FVEVAPRKHRRRAWRDRFGESVPLVLERNQSPGGQADRIRGSGTPADRAEEHQAVDQFRMIGREQAGDDGSPGMGNDRDAFHPMPPANKANRMLELTTRVRGAAERRHSFCGPSHLRIRVGEPAEAVEIQPPYVKPGRVEYVPPGSAVESMRDRKA